MIKPYLAMTAAEIRKTDPLPEKIAYMACHFSPYSTGISNLPDWLPEGSMLILNDITPIHRHDGNIITEQIIQCIQTLGCSSLLLDFEREANEEMEEIVRAILQASICPTAVTAPMAKKFPCPVFLPPCPLLTTLSDYLAQWKGQEIWLEISNDPVNVSLTAKGCKAEPVQFQKPSKPVHRDPCLSCHYSIEAGSDIAKILLWRDQEDMQQLLSQAEQSGVTKAIGLYQQMHL